MSVPTSVHYDLSYIRKGRVFSYAHQIQSVIDLGARRVLEVGPGPQIVTDTLRKVGIEVVTLDVEESISPDLLAPVTNIPAEARAFDAAICCQVLEHLPFDQVGKAVQELRRVVSVGAVISVPDVTRFAGVEVAGPKIGRRRFEGVIPRLSPAARIPQTRFEEMGHYWEAGYGETPLSKVRTELSLPSWKLAKTWRVPELMWHRFFLFLI